MQSFRGSLTTCADVQMMCRVADMEVMWSRGSAGSIKIHQQEEQEQEQEQEQVWERCLCRGAGAGAVMLVQRGGAEQV